MSLRFEKDGFAVALAQGEDDIQQVQRLRYDVFVRELGGQGAGVDHRAQIETDRFDPVSDHLLIRDCKTEQTIGAYRLMRKPAADRLGGFYSSNEFDLTPLLNSGRELLELGRSCVRADYRAGPALFHLWSGLAQYVALHGSEILFGVASFPGTELQALRAPLSLLHHRYSADAALRPKSLQNNGFTPIPNNKIDPKSAMIDVPPLIKSYLKSGARIGQGVFIDHAFNCTDICTVLPARQITQSTAMRIKRAAAG